MTVKLQLLLIPKARDLVNGSWGYEWAKYKIFRRKMSCSMYSSLLLEQAGSAHCMNEQTTVVQPVAGPKDGYPSVGKNVTQKDKKIGLERYDFSREVGYA